MFWQIIIFEISMISTFHLIKIFTFWKSRRIHIERMFKHNQSPAQAWIELKITKNWLSSSCFGGVHFWKKYLMACLTVKKTRVVFWIFFSLQAIFMFVSKFKCFHKEEHECTECIRKIFSSYLSIKPKSFEFYHFCFFGLIAKTQSKTRMVEHVLIVFAKNGEMWICMHGCLK